MKKIITIAVLLYAAPAIAQSNGSQSIVMNTGNALELSFVATNGQTGSTISLPFNTTSDYSAGVTSSDQQMKVISNKNFNVAVKASAANFTYSGNTTPAPSMPVNNILLVTVASNQTGGSVAGSFGSYATITSANQNIITNGSVGTNQLFAVRYKATPGFAYPAGTYTIDIVYTATQL